MSLPTSKHEYWRQLTAIAPTGELTDDEIFQLAEHLDQCAECRELLAEYDSASTIFPFLEAGPVSEEDEAIHGGSHLAQREARNRVTARLTEAGAIRGESRARPVALPVPAPLLRPRWVGGLPALGLACAVALAAGIGLWNVHQARERARDAEAKNAALRSALDDAAQQVAILQASQKSLLSQVDNKSRDVSLLARQGADLAREGAEASTALTQLSSTHQTDLSRLNELSEKLKALGAELDVARGEARALGAQKQDLESRLQAAAKFSTAQAADHQTKTAQLESRIQDLTRRSDDQKIAIQRQEKLLSTDRDIRDLMGARNLHIIDAADNTAGRQEPWFGRVFYTEGKSLVFYAFDLDQQKNLKPAAAFQVWGEKQGIKAKARSLGVFYVDQKSRDRWILRFEDPDVLAQIDRVYVTVEPAGGSASPHGKELLATNLAIPANHP